MNTTKKMTRAEADARMSHIEHRLGEIEDEIYDLKGERDRLEAEAAEIEDDHPAPRSVGRCEIDGVAWLCDGFRAVRGAWPTECVENRDMPAEAVGPLVRDAEAATQETTIAEHAVAVDGEYPVGVTPEGVVLRQDWLDEVMAHGARIYLFERLTFGSMAKLVAVRNAAGELVSIQMPMSPTSGIRDRVPAPQL